MKKPKNNSTPINIGAGLALLIIPTVLANILISIPRNTVPEQYYEVCPTTRKQSWYTKAVIAPELRTEQDPPCSAVVQHYGWPIIASRLVNVTKNHDGFYPTSPQHIQSKGTFSRYWLFLLITTLMIYILVSSRTSRKKPHTR